MKTRDNKINIDNSQREKIVGWYEHVSKDYFNLNIFGVVFELKTKFIFVRFRYSISLLEYSIALFRVCQYF